MHVDLLHMCTYTEVEDTLHCKDVVASGLSHLFMQFRLQRSCGARRNTASVAACEKDCRNDRSAHNCRQHRIVGHPGPSTSVSIRYFKVVMYTFCAWMDGTKRLLLRLSCSIGARGLPIWLSIVSSLLRSLTDAKKNL